MVLSFCVLQGEIACKCFWYIVSKQINGVMIRTKIMEPAILAEKLIKKNVWSDSANLNLFYYVCIILNKSIMEEQMQKVLFHIFFLQVIIFSTYLLTWCLISRSSSCIKTYFFFFYCSSLLFISANYQSPLTQCRSFQLFLYILHQDQRHLFCHHAKWAGICPCLQQDAGSIISQVH